MLPVAFKTDYEHEKPCDPTNHIYHVWYGKKFTQLLFQDWNITLKTAVKHLGFKRKYKLGKQIDETKKMI